MGIVNGQNADARDFIAVSDRSPIPASDFNRVPKLADKGKLDPYWLEFGGNGSDGELSVSSGNTNIDLGGARVVVKNYTTISITGTGSVTFTNPHTNGTIIIIRCMRDVTLTSSATPMLDASGCGSDGGASVSGSGNINGNYGEYGYNFYPLQSDRGDRGESATGSGGASNIPFDGTYAFTLREQNLAESSFAHMYPYAFVGTGGGSGGISSGGAQTSGAGGRGGGALIIECGGKWNFTTSNGISVAGEDGGSTATTAGGGGGGAGGFFLAIYRQITANSGTIDVSGGQGGSQGENRGGGGGANIINAGTASSTDAGDGGDGTSSVIKYNT